MNSLREQAMYDLIILGGGPAGYLAAERAGHGGLKTLLIEKRFIGGVCLNEGCIPSKTLLNSAKILDYARHGEAYGVSAGQAVIDQKAVIARKNKVVRNLSAGVQAQLKASHVSVKEGLGEILGRENGIIRVKVGDVGHLAEVVLAVMAIAYGADVEKVVAESTCPAVLKYAFKL